jgi:hypothetical protein
VSAPPLLANFVGLEIETIEPILEYARSEREVARVVKLKTLRELPKRPLERKENVDPMSKAPSTESSELSGSNVLRQENQDPNNANRRMDKQDP